MQIDHQVQLSILRELLFQPQARFAQLNTTELTNDHFTFHLKHLIEKGLVEKSGEIYKLTPLGIEIAGRLDIKTLEIVRQPKVGVAVFVTRMDKGKLQVLIGRRLKDPWKGKCGAFYAEKVRLGEKIEETASRCLANEVGIGADYKFIGAMRLIKKIKGVLVQDVLFTCLSAQNIEGEVQERTLESENFWVDFEEAYKLPDRFEDLERDLDLFKLRESFFEERSVVL